MFTVSKMSKGIAMSDNYILGSGLAGLLAGILNPKFELLEYGDPPKDHQAVLRFRSSEIGDAVGIPFKEVRVYKGIWHNDKPVQLSPRYINLYARKVSDTLAYRSICYLETQQRWIAPHDFQAMLREQCQDRISYNVEDMEDIIKYNEEAIISTVPIFVLAKWLNIPINCPTSDINKIYISRFRIPRSDVYMTYHYTDPTVKPYRASITGDVLIIESTWPLKEDDYKVVFRSFGLTGLTMDLVVENHIQQLGKIIPMNDAERRNFILNATLHHNIFSLGRFATWRNIILDEVYKDIQKIKLLMRKDAYEALRRHNCED